MKLPAGLGGRGRSLGLLTADWLEGSGTKFSTMQTLPDGVTLVLSEAKFEFFPAEVDTIVPLNPIGRMFRVGLALGCIGTTFFDGLLINKHYQCLPPEKKKITLDAIRLTFEFNLSLNAYTYFKN